MDMFLSLPKIIIGEGRLRRDPTAPLPWKVSLCSWSAETRAFRRAARLVAAHNHGRSSTRHGPTEVRGHLDVLHLATLTFLVVVGVLALAVRADRAAVVD